jgi:hypothetical protein
MQFRRRAGFAQYRTPPIPRASPRGRAQLDFLDDIVESRADRPRFEANYLPTPRLRPFCVQNFGGCRIGSRANSIACFIEYSPEKAVLSHCSVAEKSLRRLAIAHRLVLGKRVSRLEFVGARHLIAKKAISEQRSLLGNPA